MAVLDAVAPSGTRYEGHRITQTDPGSDNLWIVDLAPSGGDR